MIISKPYPRKGTETSFGSLNPSHPFERFQNHIPARGRKLTCLRSFAMPMQSISKPYPRKGTETGCDSPVSFAPTTNFKTISPQGDGNVVAIDTETTGLDNISKPYPRKGTETCVFACCLSVRIRISKPYPRKGTETHQSRKVMGPSMPIFQNHIPVRGRKQRLF